MMKVWLSSFSLFVSCTVAVRGDYWGLHWAVLAPDVLCDCITCFQPEMLIITWEAAFMNIFKAHITCFSSFARAKPEIILKDIMQVSSSLGSLHSYRNTKVSKSFLCTQPSASTQTNSGERNIWFVTQQYHFVQTSCQNLSIAGRKWTVLIWCFHSKCDCECSTPGLTHVGVEHHHHNRLSGFWSFTVLSQVHCSTWIVHHF